MFPDAKPEPAMYFAICDECGHKSRLFEFATDCWICLKCYRAVLEAVIDAIYEEGHDAAA